MTSESLSPQVSNFEDFLALLNVPKACELNKPIFKKMFLEATDGKKAILDSADKKVLKDDVEKIRWLYTLKPSTINIASYKDQERDYPEIAILHIGLERTDKIKRIAQFINRAIPYPLVLIFTNIMDGEDELSMFLADKRINQTDKEKWVIKDSIHTGWISLSSPSGVELDFLSSIKVSDLPFSNFLAFYQSIIERVVAIRCADHSGLFEIKGKDARKDEGVSKGPVSIDRLEGLRDIERLEAEKLDIANKLISVKQMGKQVELNTQIKKINDEIANIKSNL